MISINLNSALRFATLLAGSVKVVGLYPKGHPAVEKPVQEMVSILQDWSITRPEIRLGLLDGVLYLEDFIFANPSPSIQELSDLLRDRAVAYISMVKGVETDELGRFVALLAQKKLTGKELVKALAEKEIGRIRLTTSIEDKEEKEEQEDSALETYSKALEAIRAVIKDIEKGRLPSSDEIVTVVKNMATIAIQEPATLLGLAMIKDYDNYTFNHCVNVGILSMALSSALGHGREKIEEVGVAGFLHDIGKTRIAKQILNKPGKLTDDEFDEMKKHAEIGAEIVGAMAGMSEQVVGAVLGHHLDFNRQGYPEWARGSAPSTIGDIIAVADSYDALTSLRVYQHPINPKAAIDVLHRKSGAMLDPHLVTTFVEMQGSYPVGTLVRLDTNEIAVVYRPNPANYAYPVVKIIFDAHGVLLEKTRTVRLADDVEDRYAEIVAIVDPLLKNIEVGKYL
jgi:putative nucleotidyltransferase with HDIG domain